jgi:hypothetical protein
MKKPEAWWSNPSSARIALKLEYVAKPRETTTREANTLDIAVVCHGGCTCKVARSGFMRDGKNLMGSRRFKHSRHSGFRQRHWYRSPQRELEQR